jgi:CheY-like chemotaxis protein
LAASITDGVAPGLAEREFAEVTVDVLSGLRVLLAEDELHVRLLIEDFLKELGCEVHAVSTFEEALAAAASTDVDAAVLDVNLHGRKSFPAAEALARRRIPIVFSTGYANQGQDGSWRDRPWLQKPFMVDQLAQALRSALKSAAP